MTGAGEGGGFARRLLDRADGRIQALHPRIPRYFSADEPGNPVASIERVTEVGVPLAATPAVGAGDAESSPRSPLPDPVAAEALPSRLMPTRSSQARSSRSPGPPRAAQGRKADPLAEAAIGREPVRSAETAAGRTSTAAHAEPPLLPGEARAASERDIGGLDLAAAVARLLTDDEPDGAPAHGLRFEAAGAPQAARVGSSGPPARTGPPARSGRSGPGREAQAPPLTIHIGEIIVAPERAAANPPTQRSGAREAWKAPLSLDDYRAARARERS